VEKQGSEAELIRVGWVGRERNVKKGVGFKRWKEAEPFWVGGYGKKNTGLKWGVRVSGRRYPGF
jgi:hypothetical protein